jgi:hypothetical protein
MLLKNAKLVNKSEIWEFGKVGIWELYSTGFQKVGLGGEAGWLAFPFEGLTEFQNSQIPSFFRFFTLRKECPIKSSRLRNDRLYE